VRVGEVEGVDGVELPEMTETLRLTLTERDTETETEAEEPEAELDTKAHIATKMLLTCVWSLAEHDVVPAHCSTVDAKDVLHKHTVSDRLQLTFTAASFAQPCAHCGRFVACPAAEETRRNTATRALSVEYIVSFWSFTVLSEKDGRLLGWARGRVGLD